jgi:glycosyltransferase involved in cell wall biosynthesis
VGRAFPEKGLSVLAQALALGDASADVIGAGPEADLLRDRRSLRFLGWLPPAQTRARMQAAAALVMPSLWFENFPRTLVEAFACGLPVIASRLGALAELIEEGRTGLLFEPGSPLNLAQKIRWALDHPHELRRMGEAARAVYEERYTPEANYRQLMGIYGDVMGERHAG